MDDGDGDDDGAVDDDDEIVDDVFHYQIHADANGIRLIQMDCVDIVLYLD